MLTLLTLFALLFTFGSTSPFGLNADPYSIQAVLVAGSNGFYNYRHQADICHAYHVLRNHGVPEENIIVFMYDDIANDPDNPFPGKIYNIPNGPDVYEGVKKDYVGKDVTPENFLKVLKGDKELAAKGKKVLTSGPNDHVFIYFADHGGAGILGFPTDYLHAMDLKNALVYMHKNSLYGKLTFYVEACEAGSMFNDILPDNINMFITTASNPTESSYGTFCEEKGPLYGTCLGDEYSVAWLQDSDKQDLRTETLQTQFEHVVKNTPQSHPQQYGQKSLSSLDVGEFQGEQQPKENLIYEPVPVSGSVNSRDVPLVSLRMRIQNKKVNNENVNQLKSKLSQVVAGRRFLEKSIRNILADLCSAGFCSHVDEVLNTRRSLSNRTLDAYQQVVKLFHSKCLNLGQHYDALKYMYTFVNIIDNSDLSQTNLKKLLYTLEMSCTSHIANHGFEALV